MVFFSIFVALVGITGLLEATHPQPYKRTLKKDLSVNISGLKDSSVNYQTSPEKEGGFTFPVVDIPPELLTTIAPGIKPMQLPQLISNTPIPSSLVTENASRNCYLDCSYEYATNDG